MSKFEQNIKYNAHFILCFQGKSFEKREKKRRKFEEEAETRKVELMLRDNVNNPLTEHDHERYLSVIITCLHEIRAIVNCMCAGH